ncbi:pseudaminic acid cytidylyltransferase [Boseongicola sp. H5]|uniref:pseudaminic acid cytidylyltransferase n=1 Tax=Boseongicola sp. H5 TaxID=2763261 RepID=UPI001D0BD540|nr:pseudaminic acid cytidylyltransferase [Boseongicola sp. H5]
MNSVAVIPARGGSGRIPRKNMKMFCGRPMIAWSIAACRTAGCFDRIVVSTDDTEIADVATSEGAEVPFRRPDELADDFATTLDVMAHAAEALELHDKAIVACVYATAPFLTGATVATAVSALGSHDYVLGICDYPYPIQRSLIQAKDGTVRMEQPEHLLTRSQDLPARYHDIGQFYIARSATWIAQQPIFGPTSLGLWVPRSRVCDIDTPEDWKEAEQLFKAISNTERGGT